MAAKTSVKKYVGVYYSESKVKRWRQRADRCFWVAFKDSETGKLRWERCGWASEGWTPEAAQRRRYELLEQDRSGEYKPKKDRKADQMTFGEFMENHYLPWASQNKKHADQDDCVYRVWLADRFAKKPLNAITPLDLERLKKDLRDAGRSDSRVYGVLTLVRHAFNIADELNLWHGKNPCKRVRLPKPNNARTRFLTPEEAERVLKVLRETNPQVEQIATISLYGGLRVGEVLGLTWADVDNEHGVIHILDTKNKVPRPIFISEPIKAVLEELNRGAPDEPLFKVKQAHPVPWVSWMFKTAVDSLGLNEGVTDRRQRVCFHTLRHTYASWAVMEGVPLYVVGKALGHSSTAMTERYSHLAPESQKAAFEAVARASAKTKQTDIRKTK